MIRTGSDSRTETILVTGARGFVGGSLVACLRARGRAVVGVTRADADLTDLASTRALLTAVRPAIIVHAAGRVGGIAANVADPVGFLVENLAVGVNVVRAADEVGVRRLLNISSSCVYPRDRGLLREEDVLSGPLEPTNEGYAIAKIAVSRLCSYIARTTPDRAYRTILPCNLYGPGDHFDEASAHLVASAIEKIGRAAERREDTVEIWGDGTARREFMHIDDLCDAVSYLLARIDELPESLNVGTGVDLTVTEHYAAVAAAFGWPGTFRYELDKPAGMRRKLLDVSRLTALGWQARIGLEEGIRSTVERYRSDRLTGRAEAA